MRSAADIETRDIVLHGHRVSYRIAGQGPVILLIHGIAGSATTWSATQARLASHFTTIAPDLPGHGASDKPVGDYSLGSLASSLRDLLIALNHPGATVVGHSLGGGVALQFAYQFPEHTQRLVLVASGGLGRDVNLILRAACLPGADLFLSLLAGPVAAVGTRAAQTFVRLGWQPSPDLEEAARGFASLADNATRTAFLNTLRSVVSTGGQRVSASNRLYLAALIPSLIIAGERDPIIPYQHAVLAQQHMLNSRLVTFPKSGHMPHIDEPARFSEALTRFMTNTEPAVFTPERFAQLLRAGGSVESG